MSTTKPPHPSGLNRHDRRVTRKVAQDHIDRSHPDAKWIDIPSDQWSPEARRHPQLLRVTRNNKFLVQIYDEGTFAGPLLHRLSVNRTKLTKSGGNWADGITWEELQTIKDEVGYAQYTAVEIYPAKEDIVNDCPLRHLWVMGQDLPFGWRRSPQPKS